MGRHEVHLLRVGVVGAHVRQVRGVLVEGRLRGVGLQRLGDPVEVELVGVALPVDFGHDVLVVVVAEGAAELIVVHVGFALPLPPAPGHLVGVRHLEFPVGAFPGDAVGVGAVGQELQEKLPKLDLSAPWIREAAARGPQDLVRIQLRPRVFGLGRRGRRQLGSFRRGGWMAVTGPG